MHLYSTALHVPSFSPSDRQEQRRYALPLMHVTSTSVSRMHRRFVGAT